MAALALREEIPQAGGRAQVVTEGVTLAVNWLGQGGAAALFLSTGVLLAILVVRIGRATGKDRPTASRGRDCAVSVEWSTADRTGSTNPARDEGRGNVNQAPWVSEAGLRVENVKYTCNSFMPEGDELGEKYSWAEQATKLNEGGHALGPEYFPDHIYNKKLRNATRQKFPDIFQAFRYYVISEAAARILREFDLGNGALYPVRLTEADMKTPIGEGWYCFNFGNAKPSVVREETRGMVPPRPGFWLLSGMRKDGDIAVSEAALAGPDVWVDPRLIRGFFVSAEVGKAIKQAKLKGFFLSKCKLTTAAPNLYVPGTQ